MAEELDDERQIRWYLLALYVCDSISPLPSDVRLKLAHLSEQFCGDSTWDALVEEEFELTQQMVRGIHAACLSTRDSFSSMAFILRGLGCPNPEDSIRSALT